MRGTAPFSVGLYRPEISGALGKTNAQRYSVEKFLATTRVQQRFTQPFTVAYDSLIGKPTTATTGASAEDEAASAATTEGAAAKEAPEADGAGSKKTASREAHVANFRAQCEETDRPIRGRVCVR